MFVDKDILRTEIRRRKRDLTEAEILYASLQLAEMLIATPQYQNADTLYLYLPYNQEVRTVPILEHALAAGKRVAVPKVYGKEMRFIYISSMADVAPGLRGIPEPVLDGPEAEDPYALVIMPGLAFDREGNRIGYGGGYYDKFLSREQEHPTVGLCYGFQMVDSIPKEEWDVPVDLVLWI